MPVSLPNKLKLSPSKKLKIGRLIFEKRRSAKSLCKEFGISRPYVYKLRSLYINPSEKTLSENKRGVSCGRLLSKKQIREILKVIYKNPNFGISKVYQQIYANNQKQVVSKSGIQSFFEKFYLNTKRGRRLFFKYATKLQFGQLLDDIYSSLKTRGCLSPEERLSAIKLSKKMNSIAYVCKLYKISRANYYKWQKRYQDSFPGQEINSLSNRKPKIDRYYRQLTDEQVESVLDIVRQHPEYSTHNISQVLASIGNHGIQNLFKRLSLNTYARRSAYASQFVPEPLVTPAAYPSFVDQLMQIFAHIPALAAIPPPIKNILKNSLKNLRYLNFRLLKEKLAPLSRPFFGSLISSFLLSYSLFYWSGMLSGAGETSERIGLLFASVSLLIGGFFFLYSMKYYLTLVVVLSFSRRSREEGGEYQENDTINNNRGGFLNWAGEIFGINSGAGGEGNQGENDQPKILSHAGGLQPDLDHIKPGRYPFVSIHLPFYNESKVAERIIKACTSMDYPTDKEGKALYEVIVCDDSTDKTVEIVENLAKEHNYSHPKGPFVKVLHRPTREGFKGGALKYALLKMNPKTEFVCVFDADFVPYPDTLTQFVRYFVATGGWRESQNFQANTLATMPYDTNTKVEITGEEKQRLAEQVKALRGKSNIAVVAGYQWHVLNKSENWVTRGVRSEYAGSYVIERPGQEILGGLKIIHGSVYCIRADVLKHFGWGTSITEDYELTLRIYEEGFKVIYTPYIQAPSECVSTIKRLIRQRMRWAEGHSYNTRKMFGKLITNPRLSLSEKLEFMYISPYYLQAAFFILGTLSWLISETVFKARLPFWTSLWGWSLVLTNMFALPLVNAVGLFVEEAEEKDFLGIASFVILSYLLVPFQAYAAVKGFIEKEEGTWFRTPKTGRITDIFSQGRFYRFVMGIIPGRKLALRPLANMVRRSSFQVNFKKEGLLPNLSDNLSFLSPYLSLATANSRFNSFRIPPKRLRYISRLMIVLLLLSSMVLSFTAIPLEQAMASTGTFYFRDNGADIVETGDNAPRKRMTTDEIGSTTKSVTLQASVGTTVPETYYFNVSSAVGLSNPSGVNIGATAAIGYNTCYGSQKKLFRDNYGNLIALWVNAANADIYASYLNYDAASWLIYPNAIAVGVSAANVSGALDNIGNGYTGVSNLYIAFEDIGIGNSSNGMIKAAKITPSYNASKGLNPSGWTVGSPVLLEQPGSGTDKRARPSLVIDRNNYPAVAWARSITSGSKLGQVHFSRACSSAMNAWVGATSRTTTCPAGVAYDVVYNSAAYSDMHVALEQMPVAVGSTAGLYAFVVQNSNSDLYIFQAKGTGTSTYAGWPLISGAAKSGTVGSYTKASPYALATAQDSVNYGIVYAWANAADNTTTVVRKNASNDANASDTALGPSSDTSGYDHFSLGAGGTRPDYYLLQHEYNVYPDNGPTTYRFRTTAVDWSTSSFIANGSGVTRTYSSVRADLTRGGRVDILTSGDTGERRYFNIPLYYQTMSTSVGASAANQPVGYNGWDYLYFTTSTFASSTPIASDNWPVHVCVGAGYTANQDIYARWELTNTDGTSIGATSAEQTWSSSANGQQCSGDGGGAEGNLSFTSPYATISDLQNYRARVRFRWTHTTADSIPLRYDYNSGSKADGSLTITTITGMTPATDTFYILTDNFNKKWTSGDLKVNSDTSTTEQRNMDIATDSSGNTVAVWEDERHSYDQGTFSVANTSSYGRFNNTATPLNNGKVLLAGANSTLSGFSIAELYDPSVNTFSIANTSSYGHWYHTATLLNNGKVLLAGASSGSGISIAELYDPSVNTFSIANTSSYGHYRSTATLLNNGKVLVAGVGTGSGSGGSIAELYDPSTNTFSIAATSSYPRSYHTATLLNNGKVLLAGAGDGSGISIAELYDPSTNTFSIAATSYGRFHNTATLLNDGKVLLAGADSTLSGFSIAELYDPSVNTFSIAKTSSYGYCRSTATLLNNGKVLLTGSDTGSGLSIAELYDPSVNTFSIAATSSYGRYRSTATLLNNGKVLVAGAGAGSGDSIAEIYTPKTADIYAQRYDKDGNKLWASDVRVNSDDGNRGVGGSNPANYDHLNPKVKLDTSGNAIIAWQQATNSVYGDDIWAQKLNTSGAKQWPSGTSNSFSVANTLSYSRLNSKIVPLNNGKVLVAGGGGSGSSIAELYDPSTNSFSIANTSSFGHDYMIATLLNNGKVMIIGGPSFSGTSIAELYDPSTNSFSIANTSSYQHYASPATLLNNGKVLVFNTTTNTPEIFDPLTNTFSSADTFSSDHQYGSITLLNNGKVLVIGGPFSGEFSLAELFDPERNNASIASTSYYGREAFTATLLNNGKVLVVGSDVDPGLTIAELYDPSTNSFSIANTSTCSRKNHIAVLLNNGKVLIAGTSNGSCGVSIAELYDPSANTFSIAATTQISSFSVATLLNNGKVLLSGGSLTASLYTPASDIQVSNDGSPTNGYGVPRPEHPDNGKGILGEQRNPVVGIDDNNNAVIAWEDTRYSAIQNWGLSFDYDSNAWRQTNVNLGANGTCNGGGGSSNSCGATSLMSSRPVRIMAQKLSSSNGARQWGDDLSAVNTNNPEDLGMSATGDVNSNPAMIISGSNPIITWESNSGKPPNGNARDYNIYAQKFDANGKARWGGSFSIANTSSYGHEDNTATLLNNGKVLVAGSSSDSGFSIAELYDPSTNTFSVANTSSYGHSYHTATLLNNGNVLLVGANTDSGSSIAELYDPGTNTFSIANTSPYGRTGNTATLLNNGKVLVAGSISGSSGYSIAELYDPGTNTFSIANTSSYGHRYHTATLLNNGNVLLVGEQTGSGFSIAELYDPSTNTFSVANTASYGHVYHTATLLNNGNVLLVGAQTGSGSSIAELYDPSTNTFSVANTSPYGRVGNTAALLNNGKVLVAGSGSGSGSSIAELFDPATNTFSIANTSSYPHLYPTATLLNNGKVLVAGSGIGSGFSIAELYSLDQMVNTGVDLADQRNPTLASDGTNLIFAWQGRRGSGQGGGGSSGDSERGGGSWKILGMKTNNPTSGALTNQWPSGTTNTFSIAATSSYDHRSGTATFLNNGKVLVAGANTGSGSSIAELYDPSTNTFSIANTSSYGHTSNTATLLNNGKVLAAGSSTGSGFSIAELYDPATNTFSIANTSFYGRSSHVTILLNNGKVLLAGSFSGSDSIAELYDPSTNTFSIANTSSYGRYNFTATLLNNGKVLVAGASSSGSGFSIAELYDPSTNTFSIANTSSYSRDNSVTTLLNNGKVLVSGALTGSGYSIAELYDPSTNTFSIAATSSYGRLNSTAILLNNGKVLVAGASSTGSGKSIAELYNPSGELALSHDWAMAGDQEKPKVAIYGTDIFAVWEDNRSSTGSAVFNRSEGNKRIFMQKFDTNGIMQWPSASVGTGLTSPYSVSDVMVSTTYPGTTSNDYLHYSGRPVIGGLYADGGSIPMVIGWEDNRNRATDPIDVYSQSYDTVEYDLQKTDWKVYFRADQAASLTVGVDLVEANGLTQVIGGVGTGQTWTSCEGAGCSALQLRTWTSGGTPAPPADTVQNITMRRARVTFTRTSGTVTLSYDNTDNESRLELGTVVPEKSIILGMIVPFLPPIIQLLRRKQKKKKQRKKGDDEPDS